MPDRRVLIGIPLFRVPCESGACAPEFPSRSRGPSAADLKRSPGTVTPRRNTLGGVAIIHSSADGVGTNEINAPDRQVEDLRLVLAGTVHDGGIDGLLQDKTRPSRIPPLGPEVAARVVALTLADPPVETTHWTADLMARASGISASAVRRIWKAHGLQPHRYRQFKLSNDPNFVDKLRDVVGLYVDPPAHAIVLSLDEKSQIQALDRPSRACR